MVAIYYDYMVVIYYYSAFFFFFNEIIKLSNKGDCDIIVFITLFVSTLTENCSCPLLQRLTDVYILLHAILVVTIWMEPAWLNFKKVITEMIFG